MAIYALHRGGSAYATRSRDSGTFVRRPPVLPVQGVPTNLAVPPPPPKNPPPTEDGGEKSPADVKDK